MDLESLRAAIERGESFDYVFFWKHRQRSKGRPDESCLSQWFPSRFEADGDTYPSAEHFMMAEKARLFGDDEIRRAILAAEDPGQVQSLGRKVSGFDEATWVEYRYTIVCRASALKFGQNPKLGDYLRNTGHRVLVEASPMDRIWGIGLAADHENAARPDKWLGLNLLGFALMHARSELA